MSSPYDHLTCAEQPLQLEDQLHVLSIHSPRSLPADQSGSDNTSEASVRQKCQKTRNDAQDVKEFFQEENG